jgi:hypothetical protein
VARTLDAMDSRPVQTPGKIAGLPHTGILVQKAMSRINLSEPWTDE